MNNTINLLLPLLEILIIKLDRDKMRELHLRRRKKRIHGSELLDRKEGSDTMIEKHKANRRYC